MSKVQVERTEMDYADLAGEFVMILMFMDGQIETAMALMRSYTPEKLGRKMDEFCQNGTFNFAQEPDDKNIQELADKLIAAAAPANTTATEVQS